MIVYMILLFISITNIYPAQLHITTAQGKHCLLRSENTQHGVCVFLKDCPQLWKNNRNKNETLQLCGVEKQDPLVCCVMKPTGTSMTSAIPLSYTYPERPTKSDVPISQKMCREYAKMVYEGQDKKTERCTVRSSYLGAGRALFGEFPHMASLQYTDDDNKTQSKCGGSLISERYVLTAAHCLKTPGNDRLEWVLLGAVNIENITNSGGQLIPIAQRIPHPDYKPPRKYFDLGLIKLARAPILGPFVRPACLPADDENFSSSPLILTGWGATNFAGDPSTDLLKVPLIEAPYQICTQTYDNFRRALRYGIQNESMLCAGHPTGKADACQGDSGGPLQVVSTDHHCMYKIVAVTSFGKGCGNGGIPGVYSRVQYFRKWIENIVWS